MKRNLADRNVVKLSDAKTLELKDEHWQSMSNLLPVLQPLGREGGGGDRRPDPAPFPADDGTPSRSTQRAVARPKWPGEGTGITIWEAQWPSAPEEGPGNHSPPPRQTPLDNRPTQW